MRFGRCSPPELGIALERLRVPGPIDGEGRREQERGDNFNGIAGQLIYLVLEEGVEPSYPVKDAGF